MPLNQVIFFNLVALFMFILAVELVRRRMLQEYYSWLWMAIAVSFFLIVNEYHALVKISQFMTMTPTALIMFLGIIALVVMILQLSVMVSSQTNQIKNLAQEVALLEAELEKEAAKKKS